MPGGRARGNPAQIFSENSQKFPSTDLKNILYFDISMYPSYIWHMNFGQSPLGLDFGVFGPLCGQLWKLISQKLKIGRTLPQ